MLKNLLGIIVIFSHLSVNAFGCDQDDLNSKAGDLSGKIFNSQQVSKETIVGNLGFVYDDDRIRAKYKNSADFQTLWDQKTRAISDNSYFEKFAGVCKEIFEEGLSPQKSAVHMLFERVSSKLQNYLVYQQRRANMPEMSSEELKRKVQAFVNVDRVDSPTSTGSPPPVGSRIVIN